jgi:hypothetical protein
LSIGQLPLVVVWAVALVVDDELEDDAVDAVDEESAYDVEDAVVLVVALAPVVVLVRFVAADADCVLAMVAVWPSRHANRPPSESMLVGASMPVNLRMPDEGVPRAQ